MIEQKQNDWVLNLLSNSDFSTADFKSVGLNASNTSLQSEETYKSSKQIQDLFQREDGTFDNETFHKFYENAQLTYNMLANDTFIDDMYKQQAIYGKDNIFAPKEQRRDFSQTVQHLKVSNPDRTTTGLVRVGETSNPTMSRSEIAQTQKVLVNPTEVYDKDGNADWSKAQWHESPNDSWFEDFFDTRVLAQWESDGEHVDPITGQTVKHQKGQARLNEEGTYYYENLDGRDIYGKQVLNKMNTLTTDGSFWNKYDFFDSDDLEQKSAMGSILKNAALVGTMFIPYVGPWIAGLSVASQLVGLSGTLGKMLPGSDSPIFSALEGWSKSVNRQTAKSQYAMENTWCWENFINLIGDVAGQLKEQRFLFEFTPAIIKGSKTLGWNGISQSKQTAYSLERAKYYDKLLTTKFKDMEALRKNAGKAITESELKSYATAKQATMLMGNSDVEKFMKSYQHIGSILSKGYMTAITVGDTYGEAKYEAGATDTEAALLTLGYAAAEAALLNTGVGEWILPELKASGLKTKAIINAIAEVPDAMRLTSTNLSKIGKKESAKYWFTKGKEVAENLMSKGKGLVGSVISGGLGEGVEEMAEEFLADFSKSCFNTVQWLAGTDKRMTAWDNMSDRYLMSLVGGAVGGGLTAAGTDFKISTSAMSSEQAMQEMIFMLRENKKDELFKTLNKMTLADPYRQNESEVLSDGTVVFKPSTSNTSNMDKDIKQAFINQVNLIDNIIKAEGIKLSDNAFLDTQTFRDIRLANLQNSSISGLYLQDFNSLCKEIVQTQNEINTLSKKGADSKEIDKADESHLQALNKKLLDLRIKKDQYVNGELAMDYTSLALFEMTPIVSQYFSTMFFKDYVDKKYHRKIETLSESELKKYRDEFDNWKQNEGKNDIVTKGHIYLDLARNSGLFIQEFAKNYDNIRKSKSIQDLIKTRLKNQAALNMSIDPGDNLVNDTLIELDTWINLASNLELQESTSTAIAMIHNKGSKKVKDTLDMMLQTMNTMDKTSPTYQKDWDAMSTQVADLISKELAYNIDNYLDEFINAGAINPEIKNGLKKVVSGAKTWLTQFSNGLKGLRVPEIIGILNGKWIDADENTTLEELAATQDPYDLAEAFGGDINQVINFMHNSLQLLGIDKPEITIGDFNMLRDEIATLNENLDKKADALDRVSYTDSMQFIQNFIQTNSDSGLDMYKLVETVNAVLEDNQTNLAGVNLMEVAEQIDEAIEVIGWLQGLVIGAQTDSDASLDNLIGYNVTLNEIAKKHKVKDWEQLPMISTQDSQIINQDLQLIKNKLIHAKNIHAINQGKKLNLQNRVSANKNYITYNRLKKFIVNVDDSWADKKILEDALEKAEMLKKFAEKRQQTTDANRKSMEKEMTAIDDAFYTFFNNEENVKKIKNGDLYTLFQKDFDLYGDTDQLINESTEVLDDRNLLYWLASRAAIKKSAFNNELRQVIDPESGLAPIPTQQEAVFHNLAEILNGDLITAFTEGYRKAMLEDFNKRSRSSKLDLLVNRLKQNKLDAEDIIDKGTIKNIDVFPKYSNIYLTEGIPGAGKSKAVDYYTVQILKKFHGDFIKDAWLVNNTVPNAEKLAKSIKVDFKELFDKNKFMKRIYSKYNTARTINAKGAYIYDKSEWTKTVEGEYVYNAKSDDLTEIPSLIIIDEISHYDQADLELINDFAKKNGITVITSGDFQQSTTLAQFTNEDGLDVILTPARGLFKHAPKLGVSMRSNNSQMDKTITNFQAHPANSKEPIDTYWYMDDKAFNGVKQVLHTEDAEIERIIDHMMATAKVDSETGEKEKVGLIYFNDDSKALKILERKYAGKYEKFKDTSAQGLEGQYYIIDFHGSNRDGINKKQDLYTGISRAEQGALVIYTSGIDVPQALRQHQETASTKTGFDKNHLKSYAIDAKKLLDELCGDSKEFLEKKDRAKVNVTRPTSTPTPATVTTTPTATPTVAAATVTWVKPDEVKDFIYKDTKYATDGVKIGKYNNSGEIELLEDSDSLTTEVLTAFNTRMEDPELGIASEISEEKLGSTVYEMTVTETPKEPISEDTSEMKNFTYLLHTHNTFELGLKIDNNGKLQFLDPDMKRYEHRIDSAIGLMKVYEADWKNPTNNADFYIDKIAKLRNALFNIQDKTVLMNYIGNILDGVTITDLEFGLVSTPNIKKASLANGQRWGYGKESGKYGMFDKHAEEKTMHNEVDASMGRKTINATFTLENGKRVSIPLFILGNLETYTRNPKGPIAQKLKTIYDRVNGQSDPYAFHEAVINDKDLKKIPEIYNLAKLWVFTNAAYFKIDDSSWTPAKDLKNWGIQINTDAISGGRYSYQGADSFKPINDFIKGTGFNFSKQIYTTLDVFEDEHGNEYEIANKGHAFILISQDPSIETDKEMEEQYKKQLIDKNEPKKVTRAYIMPPKVPIKYYLKNLYDLVNEKNDRNKIKRLGSHLTSYYIWSSLLDKMDDPLFNSIDKNTKEKLKEEIIRLKAIENQIESETDPERIAALKNDLLNEVMGPQTWEGVATSRVTQSLQEHLNFQLLNTFTSMADNSIITENFDRLVQLIEDSGIKHIFYSPKFKNKVPDSSQLLVALESDQDTSNNSKYTIDGLPFSINAKVDSSLFSIGQEFNSIIESFVNKIQPTDTVHLREWSLDTNLYLNPVSTGPTITNSEINIPLEENSEGIDNININISPLGIVTVNGNITRLTPDQARAIKIYNKNEIKLRLVNSLNGVFATEIDNAVKTAYDGQIEFIVKGWDYDPITSIINTIILKAINTINSELPKSVAFLSGDKVIMRTFTDEELSEMKLEDGIILDEELNFGDDSELIIPYKGIKIIFNKNTNTINLFKDPVVSEEPPITEGTNWTEISLLDPKFATWLEDLGILEDINNVATREGMSTVAEMWGYDEVLDTLKRIESDDPELKSLINYLQDENNDPDKYCPTGI